MLLFAPSGAPVYKEPRLLVQAQSAIDYLDYLAVR